MGRNFENRKQAILKRGARDSKAFTRCGRHISMAVKAGGGDPDGNPSLRRAMQNARAVNMPKDKMLAAIDKALGLGDTENFQESLYAARLVLILPWPHEVEFVAGVQDGGLVDEELSG